MKCDYSNQNDQEGFEINGIIALKDYDLRWIDDERFLQVEWKMIFCEYIWLWKKCMIVWGRLCPFREEENSTVKRTALNSRLLGQTIACLVQQAPIGVLTGLLSHAFTLYCPTNYITH